MRYWPVLCTPFHICWWRTSCLPSLCTTYCGISISHHTLKQEFGLSRYEGTGRIYMKIGCCVNPIGVKHQYWKWLWFGIPQSVFKTTKEFLFCTQKKFNPIVNTDWKFKHKRRSSLYGVQSGTTVDCGDEIFISSCSMLCLFIYVNSWVSNEKQFRIFQICRYSCATNMSIENCSDVSSFNFSMKSILNEHEWRR